MTQFEKMLLKKGYRKYILNCRTMKYEPTDKHIISSMVNLDHRYIHESDEVLIKKIEQGKGFMDDSITLEDVKGVICFGLRERNKPPTLIHPRPRINVKREGYINGEKTVVIENEFYDDSMNLVLSNEDPEKIFDALFNRSVCFEYDLIN